MDIKKIILSLIVFTCGCCDLCNFGRDDNQKVKDLIYNEAGNSPLLFPFYNKPPVISPSTNDLRNLIYNRQGHLKAYVPLSTNATDEYSKQLFVGVVFNNRSKKQEPVIVQKNDTSLHIIADLATTKSLIEQTGMDYNKYCSDLLSKGTPTTRVVHNDSSTFSAAEDGSPLFIPFNRNPDDFDRPPDKDDFVNIILNMHKTSITELGKLQTASRPIWGILFEKKQRYFTPVIFNTKNNEKIYDILDLCYQAAIDKRLGLGTERNYYEMLLRLAGVPNPN